MMPWPVQLAQDFDAFGPLPITSVDKAPSSVAEVIGGYMGVFFIAYFVAFFFTPLMRVLAVRNGIIDWPDLKRKNHIEPIAYLGGVGIFLGWLVAVMLSYVVTPAPSLHGQHALFPLSIIFGAAVICLTGLFDDVWGISPRVKVGGQLLAAAAIASQKVGDIIVSDFLSLAGLPHEVAWLNYILGTAVIAIFIVGACNAVNLLDGLDGLASGVTGICCTGFLILASLVALQYTDLGPQDGFYSHVRLVMCLAIVGAILGFLPYNFNPANIFMGDAGSLLLGYLAAVSMLLFAHVPTTSLKYVTACIIIFALPITDTALAIFRRKLRGQPIFHPDNQHIHHLLRRSGLTVRQSVLALYAISAGFTVVGCVMVGLDFQWRYMLAVFFVLFGFVIVTAYKIGHRMVLAEQAATAAAAIAPDPVASEPRSNAAPPAAPPPPQPVTPVHSA